MMSIVWKDVTLSLDGLKSTLSAANLAELDSLLREAIAGLTIYQRNMLRSCVQYANTQADPPPVKEHCVWERVAADARGEIAWRTACGELYQGGIFLDCDPLTFCPGCSARLFQTKMPPKDYHYVCSSCGFELTCKNNQDGQYTVPCPRCAWNGELRPMECNSFSAEIGSDA